MASNQNARLKITAHGLTSTTRPSRRVMPPGWFIQELAATTEKVPPMPAEHDRQAGPEVRPRAEPVPAVDVDRDEDGLEEEEDSLDGERDAVRGAEAAHQPRPQQPELERQHRARHRADGEEHGRDLRPALGQQQRLLVAAPDAAVVGDHGDRGEGHPERHQDDVEAERERHLLAGGQQLGRIGGGEVMAGEGCGDRHHVQCLLPSACGPSSASGHSDLARAGDPSVR